MKPEEKRKHYQRRALRTRRKLRQFSPTHWRVSIFRSHQHIYAQVIDDQRGKTLLSANDFQIKINKGMTKQDKAFQVGQLLAERLRKMKKINKLVIDRGGYAYHGRVAALVEGLRKGGIEV